MTPVTGLPPRSYALLAIASVCDSMMRRTITTILLIAIIVPNNLMGGKTSDNDHDNNLPPLAHKRKIDTGTDEPEPPPPSVRSPNALEEGEKGHTARKIDCTERTCNIITNTIMVFFALGAVPYFLYLIWTAPPCSVQPALSDMTLPNFLNITSTP